MRSSSTDDDEDEVACGSTVERNEIEMFRISTTPDVQTTKKKGKEKEKVRDVLLGVDIMKLEYTGGKQLSEFFRIMNRNFSSSEWEEIRGNTTCMEVEQISMFCRHWALKESFVKALGIGIVTDLRTIDFKTNSKLVPNKLVCDTVLYQKGNKQNWLFEESLLDSEHCVAVALQENGIAPKSQNKMFELLDYNKLLVNAIPMHSEDEQYVKKYFSKNEKP
ncbi:hypothetical protein HZH66_002610 [Vespula vulgaris]|uniref:L-aminoadipate-semialdehyde dehydrogenase-phosphopantetheinyl transferase n=1 Tax=Vespula vulgaris TaxID=7454 RepID=A0A834KJY6_VESVU|nr:hypothetical protein HZH66_002610 [Vespula vulgaris]